MEVTDWWLRHGRAKQPPGGVATEGLLLQAQPLVAVEVGVEISPIAFHRLGLQRTNRTIVFELGPRTSNCG